MEDTRNQRTRDRQGTQIGGAGAKWLRSQISLCCTGALLVPPLFLKMVCDWRPAVAPHGAGTGKNRWTETPAGSPCIHLRPPSIDPSIHRSHQLDALSIMPAHGAFSRHHHACSNRDLDSFARPLIRAHGAIPLQQKHSWTRRTNPTLLECRRHAALSTTSVQTPTHIRHEPFSTHRSWQILVQPWNPSSYTLADLLLFTTGSGVAHGGINKPGGKEISEG